MFEKIKILRPHFFSLREIDNNVSLDMKLPTTWGFETIVGEYKSLKYKIQDKNDKFNLISLIGNATLEGYNTVFNCGEEIISINRENEEKQRLLKSKIKELEILFQRESLEKLKGITFIENGTKQEDSTVIRMVEQGDGEGLERDSEPQDEVD
jgi:hypothetical protein